MKAAHKELGESLRRQTIDKNGPGTILRDFETLLEFIGPDGVRATGKYHLLPIDRLFELDARMSLPLRPIAKRPQQRSFPHINGLYLLLRATRLGVPKGLGKGTGRLVLDPTMLDAWRAMNTTEQYFNLLEAWLLHARREMMGEAGGGFREAMRWTAMRLWTDLGTKGLDFRKRKRGARDWLYGQEAYCNFALLEVFGLADVERGESAEGENWPILRARRTSFGEALLGILFDFTRESFFDEKDSPGFGVWQPMLQEYFPEWRRNLTFPEPQFRDGVYYFKAKLGSPWRRIAVPADHDLDGLARCIISAFDFHGDHLYAFRFRERDGSQVSVEHPYVDDADRHTDDYSIGYLPLEEGESMQFEYDFGASWRFNVTLENVEPPNRRMKKPRIVESHGKAPKEYWDEDEYDDGEDDETD